MMTGNLPKYFDPRTLAKLKGLQLRARHIVEGHVTGLHHGRQRGFSTEFVEHREYEPGDDLRYVDWKVFGRTDKVYLKQFEDETNLVCYILLDNSESMHYRGPDAAMSKYEYACCIAASLAWLVLQQRDAVGLVTFGSQIRDFVRPSSNPAHLRQLLRTMETAKPDSKTAAGNVFHELAERFDRRGIVLILSDLFDDVQHVLAGLNHFRHRRHDVIVFHTLDAAELDFPFRRPTMLRGLEQSPDVLIEPRYVKHAYLKSFARFRERISRGCGQHQVEYSLMRTDATLDIALTRFVATRLTSSR